MIFPLNRLGSANHNASFDALEEDDIRLWRVAAHYVTKVRLSCRGHIDGRYAVTI